MGRWYFLYTNWVRDRIKKYRTSWKRVEYWREINAAVKVTAARLAELTTEGEKEAKLGQPVWNDFEFEKWKIS